MNDNNVMDDERPNGSAPAMQSMNIHPEENIGLQELVATRDTVENAPLSWLKAEEVDELQSRWNSIQVEFVDDPRASVSEARIVVNKALELIDREFAAQRAAIDAQWVNQMGTSTEDLRLALQHYRAFLNRLLE
jgi:hypothetical protein